MPDSIAIAVDVMGGDFGHVAAIEAACSALADHPHLHIVLVGDSDKIKAALFGVKQDMTPRLRIVHADDVVSMHDAPRLAVRSKKNSSMRLAIDLVQSGEAQACVSSGNTGALVAISKFVLKTVANIKRPAILSPLPAKNGLTVMLDLGANATCTVRNYLDFALMGSVVAQYDYQIQKPRVGLLNIGTEEGKGSAILNEVHDMLNECELNYIGFVEGDDIFSEHVDVVVTDGFTGNIALKTMEGFADFFMGKLRQYQAANNLTTDGSGSGGASLLDRRAHNGASLVGLNGVVIKSHGGADALAIKYAIETAISECNSQLPRRIEKAMVETITCVESH